MPRVVTLYRPAVQLICR